MSVIIRLQNLPWSANALDIRQFFRGLSIPDGGVHIVGGEMGDAFIAFSTDEDARQAMMLDRGKLKEVQVRLLLSSRAEMQKVIETARQTSLAMMQMSAKPQQNKPMPVPQPPVITPTSLKNILSQPPNSTNMTGNDNSMASFTSYNANAQFTENSLDSRDSRDKTEVTDQVRGSSSYDRQRGRDRFDRSSRSRSRSRERRRSRSRDRGSRRRREHSRSRSRDRYNRRRRSRSTDRKYDRSDNKTRDRDRSDRGHTEKDALNKSDEAVVISDDNERNSPNNKTVGVWDVPPQPVFQTNFTKGYSTYSSGGNENQNKPYQVGKTGYSTQTNQGVTIQQQLQQQLLQQQLQLQQLQQQKIALEPEIKPTQQESTEQKPPEGFNFQNYFNSSFATMGTYPQFAGNSIVKRNEMKNTIAFQNPYNIASMTNTAPVQNIPTENKNAGKATTFTGLFNNIYNAHEQKPAIDETSPINKPIEEKSPKIEPTSDQTQNQETPKPAEINYDELEGNCIKISNMCSGTTYSELRRFFSGLYIANNGIKMINDKHGLRVGTAYVRFVRRESKPKAFIRNGSILKNKRVLIESVTEQEFDEAIDSFKPTRNFSNVRYDMDRDRMKDNSPVAQKKDDAIEKEEIKFTTLLLEDIPPFAKEQDIIKMFSSYTLFDIVLTRNEEGRKQYICYVKFHRAEDAKNAIADTANHIIGHKKIFVTSCTEEAYEKAKAKYNMPEDYVEEEEVKENQSVEMDESTISEEQNKVSEDSNEKNNSAESQKSESENRIPFDPRLPENGAAVTIKSDDSSQIPSLFSITPCPPPTSITAPVDPRRRGSARQGSRFNRPEDNDNKTNFALIKNCDYKSTKRDFKKFFSDIGISPTRVEILLNARNQPSGDCICEFQSSDEAEKSLFKSSHYCGNRCVHIELISPKDVAERLGEGFLHQTPQPLNNIGLMNMNMNQMPPMDGNNMNFNPNMPPELMNYMNNPFGNNMNMNMNSNFGFNPNPINNFNQQGGPNNPFRNSNNNNNNSNNMPPRNIGEQFDPRNGGGGSGGGNSNSGGGRRGQRPSRFSDFDASGNPRSAGNGVGGPAIDEMPPQSLPPVLGDASVDQFGQPGCVVGMENVPYKAGIDDILEFFNKFNVQPHNVIRRYNDDGTPTGDARVAFTSPMEARAAMETKRNQKIFNRTIYLILV